MTSNKKLEKRMNVNIFVGCIITLLITFGLLITAELFSPNYIEASPDFFCEQGLIEWENEDNHMRFMNCVCLTDDGEIALNVSEFIRPNKPIGIEGDVDNDKNIFVSTIYSDTCDTIIRCELGRKTCPYSGPGILVSDTKTVIPDGYHTIYGVYNPSEAPIYTWKRMVKP